MEAVLPTLAQHLEQGVVKLEMLGFRALMGMFVSVFPLETVFRSKSGLFGFTRVILNEHVCGGFLAYGSVSLSSCPPVLVLFLTPLSCPTLSLLQDLISAIQYRVLYVGCYVHVI